MTDYTDDRVLVDALPQKKGVAVLCKCDNGECQGHFHCRIVWTPAAIAKHTNLRHPNSSAEAGVRALTGEGE